MPNDHKQSVTGPLYNEQTTNTHLLLIHEHTHTESGIHTVGT